MGHIPDVVFMVIELVTCKQYYVVHLLYCSRSNALPPLPHLQVPYSRYAVLTQQELTVAVNIASIHSA
jgi:hypothetical protein